MSCLVWISFLLAHEPLVVAGDQQTPALPSVDLPPEFARVLRDYESAWAARDPAALAILFAEDGFVLPSGRPPIRGRQAIEAYYQGHGGPLALRALDFASEGKIAYIIGTYTSAIGRPDDGKFTLTLRKDPTGRWLIVSDMDNGNHLPRREPQAPR